MACSDAACCAVCVVGTETRHAQQTAWKNGHKQECRATAARETRKRKLLYELGGMWGAERWNEIVRLQGDIERVAAEVKPEERDTAFLVRNILGVALEKTGDYKRAISVHEETMRLCEEHGDLEAVAMTSGNLGNCLYSTGHFERARELHEQHRSIALELGDKSGVATASGNLANCYRCTGDHAAACKLNEERRDLCRELGDDSGVGRACGGLGLCYEDLGDFARARAMHEKHLAVEEALGNHSGMAMARGNLGNCAYSTGDYAGAVKLYEQQKTLAESCGDRHGVATACANLANVFLSTGLHTRALELYEVHHAVVKELGDQAGIASACSNLGNYYFTVGDYTRARELYGTRQRMAEAAGDRAGVAKAYGSLGICYEGTGEYALACGMHETQRRMCAELGDRVGVARAHKNLGTCFYATGKFEDALLHFTLQYDAALEIKVPKAEKFAAFGIGAALRALAIERGEQCAHSTRDAEWWLQTAADLGQTAAHLHLARLALDDGEEDEALECMHAYLAALVEHAQHHCTGCCQRRGMDVHMLTCAGCRVAKFCSKDHQKMASKRVSEGGSALEGRHRDVCAVLCKWRQHVLKRQQPPSVLRAELLAFLRTT